MSKKASLSDNRDVRGVRFRLLAVGTILAMAVATLSALSASVSPASADVVPHLTVTINQDGSLHATWNMENQVGEEFLFDTPQATDGRLAATAAFVDCGNGQVACCPKDSWCWASQGVPLYCYWVLYNDQTGDCPGHSDLGDADTTHDTYPLKVGDTYYVQVLVADKCLPEDTHCPMAQPFFWSNVVRIVDNPASSTSTTTTTTLPSSDGSASANLAAFPTMPDNGAVNCEADNYIVKNYDLAANSRNKDVALLRTREKERAAVESELATATGDQATKLRAQLSTITWDVQQLKNIIAKLDTGMADIGQAVQAQKQSCHKTTKANPDPGQVGPFAIPTIPNNGKIQCSRLRPRAEYLRTELAKLYGNKDFDMRFNVNNEVRKKQIELRITRLEPEFNQKYLPALTACDRY